MRSWDSVIFGYHDQSFVSGRETGHYSPSPPSFDISISFFNFLRSLGHLATRTRSLEIREIKFHFFTSFIFSSTTVQINFSLLACHAFKMFLLLRSFGFTYMHIFKVYILNIFCYDSIFLRNWYPSTYIMYFYLSNLIGCLFIHLFILMIYLLMHTQITVYIDFGVIAMTHRCLEVILEVFFWVYKESSSETWVLDDHKTYLKALHTSHIFASA